MKKKALITGINGFVGKHLEQCLIQMGYEVFGTCFTEKFTSQMTRHYFMNILDKRTIDDVLKKCVPDEIYHLAGQSSVALSWIQPALTMDLNVNGTINLLESVRCYVPHCKVLIVGSSDEYGSVKQNECPIKESHKLEPISPYGISKVTQEKIAHFYVKSYQLNLLMTRSFNQIGPGQSLGFVVADFAHQIVAIENGADPVILVGNLNIYRDFLDVRDAVKAYVALLAQGKIGDIYNVGSGQAYNIRGILEKLLSYSCKDIVIKTDSKKIRTMDTPFVQCDITKIMNETRWRPSINIMDVTLKDVLISCRDRNK